MQQGVDMATLYKHTAAAVQLLAAELAALQERPHGSTAAHWKVCFALAIGYAPVL